MPEAFNVPLAVLRGTFLDTSTCLDLSPLCLELVLGQDAGEAQHNMTTMMFCQKCRTPLTLDSSLEDLNPAAYDLLVGPFSTPTNPRHHPLGLIAFDVHDKLTTDSDLIALADQEATVFATSVPPGQEQTLAIRKSNQKCTPGNLQEAEW